MSKRAKATPRSGGGGFLARRHNKLRFDELPEAFFARVILAKCSDLTSKEITHVQLSLSDLFRIYKPSELENKLVGTTFTASHKITELATDFVNAMLGSDLEAHSTTLAAADYYHNYIASRLKWLKSGEEKDNKSPCIEDFEKRVSGQSVVFDITVRPALLVERLAQHIEADLELSTKLLRVFLEAEHRPVDPGPRIDYRKQVELLTDYLEKRQKVTAESEFTILSNQMPFRWVIQQSPIGTGVTMPGIGTTTAADKILLPFFLEINGLLDIIDIDLENDPLEPNDVVVRYFVRRPAKRNIFGASNQGLDASVRAFLNETELSLYSRLHATVRDDLVFGGRPKLEMSFGTCCSWFVRKTAYCLEEPTFLGNPAREWLRQHEKDLRLQMEDQFFLPAIYERLRGDFGSRVVKKPERFGGEIDILFDDTIPIELKIRRGRREPLNAADIDEAFPPSGQAAAYAAISRLGFVVVLDLPDNDVPIANLEACATVIERRFPEGSPYPTCVVLIVFRCYKAKPSGTH
jgi:hypothetical protein